MLNWSATETQGSSQNQTHFQKTGLNTMAAAATMSDQPVSRSGALADQTYYIRRLQKSQESLLSPYQ